MATTLRKVMARSNQIFPLVPVVVKVPVIPALVKLPPGTLLSHKPESPKKG